MSTLPSNQALIDFVVREARLLDEQRLEDWLDLFAEDGHYWMPVEWGQTDPRLTTSLMYEDKLLLRIRVERLRGKLTYSQSPRSRCHHLLQQPQVDERDDGQGRYVTWTPMHYVESRGDEQTLYAAWVTHQLAVVDGTIKIRLKRVDLVNCDASLGSLQLFV
ncbi:MAG: aromatic-ring-hydroxylating dioxygenase subunit beta [Reyranellaceae bacterium]|jgi:3-phenylpropionate/cinnamic acid dioxygenase small subunit